MNKKKALIFDFDGTIADSMKLEKTALVKTINKYGIFNVTIENIEDYFGPTELGILEKILVNEDKKEYWSYFLEEYKRMQPELLTTFNGIEPLINSLKDKFSIFLVTGRSKETLDISLSYLNIASAFIKTYTGSDLGINKDINIKKLLDEYNYDISDVLYIGDSLADINTIHKINGDIISVGYRYANKEDIKKLEERNPNNVVSTVLQLKERLYQLL